MTVMPTTRPPIGLAPPDLAELLAQLLMPHAKNELGRASARFPLPNGPSGGQVGGSSPRDPVSRGPSERVPSTLRVASRSQNAGGCSAVAPPSVDAGEPCGVQLHVGSTVGIGGPLVTARCSFTGSAGQWPLLSGGAS